MGRRNDDGLTPRQRQSLKIMKDKSARKKRRAMVRKVAIVGGGVFAVLLAVGGVWVWQQGIIGRTAEAVNSAAFGSTATAGYKVESLYLEGRGRTPMAEIQKAIGVKIGDPILQISLNEVRGRLEQVQSIKSAVVERSLPSTLHIRIVEREPVALWQNQGKVTLVDDSGVVMHGVDVAPYQQLPLIVGEGAPSRVQELLNIMAAEPDLAKRFSSATRVSDRRWNVRLTNQKGDMVEVRLPENNPVAAWKKLASIEGKQHLLDRDVKVIDLRLDGKVFIKLSPDVFTGKHDDARET